MAKKINEIKEEQSFDFKDSDKVKVISTGISIHLKKDEVYEVDGSLAKVLIKNGSVKLKN